MTQEVWIAVISAGAAIVASVGAQAVGAVLSARQAAASLQQDRERLDFERDRYGAEIKAAETARFEAVKRAAFVRYLASVLSLHTYFTNMKRLGLLSLLLRPTGASFRSAVAEFHASTVEIRLIAPDVYDSTYAVGLAIDRALAEMGRSRFGRIDTEALYQLLRKARRDMQRALGIEPEGTSDAIDLAAIDSSGRATQ